MQAAVHGIFTEQMGGIRAGGAVRGRRELTENKAGDTGMERRNDAPEEDDFVC